MELRGGNHNDPGDCAWFGKATSNLNSTVSRLLLRPLLLHHQQQRVFLGGADGGHCAGMQLGISIRGLAEKAQVAQSTVFRLERGDYHVQFDTLLRVLEILDLTPDQLLNTKPAGKMISPADEKLLEYLADPEVKQVFTRISMLIQPVKKRPG